MGDFDREDVRCQQFVNLLLVIDSELAGLVRVVLAEHPFQCHVWNRGRISFLVAAFADQIDSDVQEAVLLEDLAGRLLRAFLDAFQQIRIGDPSCLPL